ncbi:hypothetical protein YC2023_019726 [Brassica napus]
MGSRDRNHSSNATGDISVTTQSEERKQCSFNAYLYNQPTGSATYIVSQELVLTFLMRYIISKVMLSYLVDIID